jgi:hypothetical protein
MNSWNPLSYLVSYQGSKFAVLDYETLRLELLLFCCTPLAVFQINQMEVRGAYKRPPPQQIFLGGEVCTSLDQPKQTRIFRG